MEKVLVIGCAKSGYWAAKLLNKKGYEVTITDQRKMMEKEELEAEGITVYDGGHPDLLKEIEWNFIVKNPGIPYSNPFVRYFMDNGIEILTEIEVALRYPIAYDVAAVTGTNGKTTVTTLLYEILKEDTIAYACGNIGTALSEIVYKHENESANIALEISAFQLLGAPTFHPQAAVITNLTPDHLDYFDSLQDYYDAKNLIYRNMTGDDWFLRNIDDETVMSNLKDIHCRIVDYSLEKEADLMLKGDEVTLFGEVLFNRNDLKIVGRHNLQNAMVAAAMAYKLDAKVSSIRKVISEFEGVEHRIEYVDEIDGVSYYNDSKGTNVDSTVTALKAFEKPVILLAGGHDKHTGFRELEAYTDRIKKLITFGETKEEIARLKDDAIICETMEEALNRAREIAVKDDVVLLSPACSSYDQFKNFEERGYIFKQLVRSFNKK
ncbi:MAG: UDP-N-acetylmuramoyl-L-alanine--D-glutamate ligase [Erysipelotrichaceae bacterium]|nr:UDP-N-acetylmuramoyl-L-alanine--D-glutamate ligase [Erysipelotrichaceae bacterium]